MTNRPTTIIVQLSRSRIACAAVAVVLAVVVVHNNKYSSRGFAGKRLSDFDFDFGHRL